MTKSKDLFLVEQLLKVFRQLVEAADPVGGHGHVDLLRVGQVQVVHDLKELEPGNFRRDLSRFFVQHLTQARLFMH